MTGIGFAVSGVPSARAQKNVIVIESALHAMVAGGLLLVFDNVSAYVSVDPFATNPVGAWFTKSLRAVSLQPGGDWAFGFRERRRAMRRGTSCGCAPEIVREVPLWASARFERSAKPRKSPRMIAEGPRSFRTDRVRDRRPLELAFKNPPAAFRRAMSKGRALLLGGLHCLCRTCAVRFMPTMRTQI